MRKNLPSYLQRQLRSLRDGHTNREIAQVLGLSTEVVNRYTQQLKEHFKDEVELQNGSGYSTKTALTLIAQRYFAEETTGATEIAVEDKASAAVIAKIRYDFLLDFFKSSHDSIYQIAARGNAVLAVDTAARVSEEIKQVLNRITDAKYRYPLLEILGSILYTRDVTNTEVAPSAEILDFSTSTAHQLQAIAKECGNAELFGLAEHCRADAYYITNQCHLAIPLLQRSLEYVKDPDERLRVLRTLALSYVDQNEKTEYQKTVNRIREIIASNRWTKMEKVGLALEGLGRCQGLLGSEKAFSTFQEAHTILSAVKQSSGKVPFREVQLMRSELETIQRLEPHDESLLQVRGTQALHIAEDHAYQRHMLQIKLLLEQS
jgi:hypothetical protein